MLRENREMGRSLTALPPVCLPGSGYSPTEAALLLERFRQNGREWQYLHRSSGLVGDHQGLVNPWVAGFNGLRQKLARGLQSFSRCRCNIRQFGPVLVRNDLVTVFKVKKESSHLTPTFQ